jgi:hypothetical protein
MEAKLAEYRARKRKEAAKQFLYNMVTLSPQQHVGYKAGNFSSSTSQEVRCVLLRFNCKALDI